jgi:hypothetical protein
MKNRTDFVIALIAFAGLALVFIARDENKMKLIKKDFTNTQFLIFFAAIVALSVIGLWKGSPRVRKATQHAFVAFMIAYLAHIDMIFFAFFLVGIFVYFTGDD